MRLTTTIDGYEVEVEVEDEMTERANCWISKMSAGIEYTASLASLHADGMLFNSYDGALPVAMATVDKITEFAEANGY
jgi:hypothetical protein